MANARRCTICGINWPFTHEYTTCPQCEDKTDPIGEATPIDADEAASLKAHAEFERFYAERELA